MLALRRFSATAGELFGWFKKNCAVLPLLAMTVYVCFFSQGIIGQNTQLKRD